MINNQNELGDIEMKSGELKNIAYNFRNNADQLRKEANRRHTRLMIMTGIVGFACIAILIMWFSDDE